jgi:hypothetical protein
MKSNFLYCKKKSYTNSFSNNNKNFLTYPTILIFTFYTSLVNTFKMALKNKITLSDSQKYEFCSFAGDKKLTRKQYVDWIEQKWGVRVNESTITRIFLKKKKKYLILNLLIQVQKT